MVRGFLFGSKHHVTHFTSVQFKGMERCLQEDADGIKEEYELVCKAVLVSEQLGCT
jgi:hypothetical protein